MNEQSSPAFEEKKPSLPLAAGTPISNKDSPPNLSESSADAGFYSGQSALHHGTQDFYAAQQPYGASHMNPYTYHHHYNLNGMAPSGAYSVGKAEYPYSHAAYREHGAFGREVQSALQEGGEKKIQTEPLQHETKVCFDRFQYFIPISVSNLPPQSSQKDP